MDDKFLFPMASRLNKPASGILWCSEDSLSAADFIGAISFHGTPSWWDTPPTKCLCLRVTTPKHSPQGGPYPHFIPIKSQARPPGGVWDHHWLSMVSGFRSSREPSVPKVQSGSKQAMATSPVMQLCMPTAIKLVKHRSARWTHVLLSDHWVIFWIRYAVRMVAWWITIFGFRRAFNSSNSS